MDHRQEVGGIGVAHRVVGPISTDGLVKKDFRVAGGYDGALYKTSIYSNISIFALLPPAHSYSFDKENRTTKEMEDLKRQGRGKVHFLPRRMFENYLLNCQALSEVLCYSDPSGKTIVGPDDISSWLADQGSDKKYFPWMECDTFEFKSSWWVNEVHAANILNDMFSALTESRVVYDKVRHGLSLTEWIIDNSPLDYVTRRSCAGLLRSMISLEISSQRPLNVWRRNRSVPRMPRTCTVSHKATVCKVSVFNF